VSKAKAQGTRYETAVTRRIRTWLTSWGDATPDLSARRLAEGGADDEGDVEAWLFASRVLVECKARQALNVQDTVAKAKVKANGGLVVLFWKRLTRSAGNTKRTAVSGVPEVVAMTPEDLFELLSAAYYYGRTHRG